MRGGGINALAQWGHNGGGDAVRPRNITMLPPPPPPPRYFQRPSNLTMLPPRFNWKPYWGMDKDAVIVHFHGPKPERCLDCIILLKQTYNRCGRKRYCGG